MLDGVRIALGVTGSIAAVRTVELAHELRRQGAAVRAVTTDAAQGIVHPWALQYATDNPAVTEITGDVEHVALCGTDGWADVLLIAPATANTIGKLAAAIDDTPVTTCATTAIGAGVPVVVAPAMHEPMHDHPGVADAIARIESWGVDLVAPTIAEGKAKLASDEAIAVATARAATPDPLAGRHVVVTAGGTREPIDPVRTLASRASGRTGRAVARACAIRGADVTLIHPDGGVPWATVRQAETTTAMRDAAVAVVTGGDAADANSQAGASEHGPADAFVSAAAIGDFTVAARDAKLDSGQPATIELEPASKAIDAVREARPDLPIVGFKAGSGDDLLADARALRDRVDCAFVVANDVRVMGATDTAATIVGPDGEEGQYEGDKAGLGERVADRLVETLDG
jgi:phosphopantothenoylcysteine decarboxylase/phosphopantothenate--cysteine ligase